MHDQMIEDGLRSTLRDEADPLPLTVTADELERRLALRRRERSSRRVGLLAAAVGVIAVGALFALAVGPIRGPTVAATPQPSVLPSAAQPSAPLSSVPPARSADPLGTVVQAVLVRPIGEDLRRPGSFEVSLFDPVVETLEVITTVPGSILPDDGWLDGGENPPVMSRSGYLAMEFTRGPNEDERFPAIAIVDLRATRDVWILDKYRDPEWGPTEELVARTWPASEDHVAWRPTGDTQTEPISGGFEFAGWSTDRTARFVGTVDGTWGSQDVNGRFTAATDLPGVYQRSGRERHAGVDAHTLGMGCDSGAVGGGCILGEWASPDDPPIRRWHTEGEGPLLADRAWAADGRGVLLLLTSPMVGGRIPVELVYAETPEHRVTIGGVEVPEWVLPGILGISAEPTPGRPTITAIGDSDGRVVAFLYDEGLVRTQDGSAWFAGWADDPEPYDPD
jgi:hypothetical protein